MSAFRNNQVQLAWFGGLSGVQARRLVPGSEAIAQVYKDQFFKSYIIANTRTGLKNSKNLTQDIAGKTFTYGSKGSTSGRLMPAFFIQQQLGQKPAELFSKTGFSGDHSRTIALVQAGAFDLGAVNYKVWENEVKAGKIDASKVRGIWETPTYPDYQWTVRGDVDKRYGEGTADKIRYACENLHNKKSPGKL